MSSKVDQALENARIRADAARARYPMMQDEPAPNAPPRAPGPGQAPTPGTAPAPSGGLQTASYEALLREVERRKLEAAKQLKDLQVQPQMLELELKLRNLPSDVREKLKEIPTDVIEAELELTRNPGDGSMILSDGSREQAIHNRASDLVKKWMDEMAEELKTEPSTVNGIALPSYMTAGYVLYLKLKEFVRSQGGVVTELMLDGNETES